MSFHQVEQIVISNIPCNNVEHKGKIIDIMCLNTKCQEARTLCSRCLLKGHSQCRDQVYEIEIIPGKLMELQQLSLDVIVLQEQINELFKELLCQIEKILSPISKYQEQPNLTNLNLIGSLLTQDSKKEVTKSIDEMKLEIKLLLDNHNGRNEKSKEQMKQYQVSQESKAQSEQKQRQTAQEWYEIGIALLENYKQNLSALCFDKTVELDPKHRDGWYRKGVLLNCYSDRYQQAIDCFDKAIELDPKHHDSWKCKGYSYLNLPAKQQECIDSYNKAIELDPKDHDSWKWKEAADCYEKAIEIDPKIHNYWFEKGVSLQSCLKYNEAIACFEKSAEIDHPSRSHGLLMIADTLHKQFRYNEAIPFLEGAIKKFPNDGNLSNYLSITQRKLKEIQNK